MAAEEPLQHLHVSVDLFCVPHLQNALHEALGTADFDAIYVPLVHSRFRRNAVAPDRDEPLTRSDLLLDSGRWSSQVAGKLSPWINLDAAHEATRKSAEVAFKQELAWACHLQVPWVLLPELSFECANYARVVNQSLLGLSYAQLQVPVPLVSRAAQVHSLRATESNQSEQVGAVDRHPRQESSWEAWNRLHTLCEWHAKLGVALEMTSDLPPQAEQDRWLAEPVRAVVLPTSLFLCNRKGFPVLSRAHQAFLIKLLRRCRCRVILRGRSKFLNGLTPHAQYVRFLFNMHCRLTPEEAFEAPYFDHLQSPLQPLMDNLEASTYETFEKDPVKYAQYEAAVCAALKERTLPSQVGVIMVVGAGRGPLVQAALNAAQSASRSVRVYAVEKNPNAVITLRGRRASEWGDRVTIVSHDMRTWQAPELCDILVSELLGSFGDNELSPECLDGAQRFLKPDGVSIPQDYVSFLAPISTSRLWNELSVQGSAIKQFETPYVVKLHNYFQLAEPQECFKFEHPVQVRIRFFMGYDSA